MPLFVTFKIERFVFAFLFLLWMMILWLPFPKRLIERNSSNNIKAKNYEKVVIYYAILFLAAISIKGQVGQVYING